MRSLFRGVLFVALAASACGKTSPSAPTPASTATTTRVISLSGSLNYGTVEIGKTSDLTLAIGNSGTGTLSVTGIACPGGYTPNWTSGTIAPGGSQQVTVRFTPTAARSYDGTLAVNGDEWKQYGGSIGDRHRAGAGARDDNRDRYRTRGGRAGRGEHRDSRWP
jgi:hypothetical protein